MRCFHRAGLAAILVSGAMVGASGSYADDSATVRFTMTVPLRCTAEAVSMTQTPTGAAILIDERCNGPRGYDLYLEHSANVTSVAYDGRSVALDPAGRTLLAASRGARDHRSRVEVGMMSDAAVSIVIAPNT